ncbi:glycoside hydrolase family 3 protein [Hydnum rufescens UP504]|uniref:beta-glucosidase n=1 Tax=Hydnum rufescens UP504 TaxID=1448309 RepID=A0A9P6AU71_9AGAM|nr:glycoside hydrolase family 3 protein [Hydnum rufescens UP504]
MISSGFPKLDVQDVLRNLAENEKIALTTGRDLWHTAPVRRLGVPSIRTSDGPNGVRGTRFFEGVPSSCFPAATGLGASWDADLLQRVGQALGLEAKAKGVHVLLGPTVNIQRSPLGGRGFESYSEDPFLSGSLARALIKGVQSEGVAATIKHFVANDQEFQRMSISSEVSMRALREIYLRTFELAIRCSTPPWAVMTAYGRLNGLHCSEHPFLLDHVLRTEWDFKGLVMSDWSGTYSSDAAIRAGLDLEMPGSTVVRGAALQRALRAKKISEHDIDARVQKSRTSGVPEDADEGYHDTPEIRALLRETASSAVVLLKNEVNLLPLSTSIKSIAIIGPDAKTALLSGGGSAFLRASYTVTPFDAISAAANEIGINHIKYARGGNAHKFAPLFGPELVASNGQRGVDINFFNEDPLKRAGVKSVYHVVSITPEASGNYEFGLASAGRADLYIDGRRIIDNSTNPAPGEIFFNTGSKEVTAIMKLKGGQTYDLLVRYSYISLVTHVEARGGVRFGVAPLKPPEEFIEEAVSVAKGVDAVVLLVGLNADFESEGYDRSDMRLPPSTDLLASAVLAANPNTAVVIQSGTPVEMPWANSANSLLQAFYGGNEVGNGIADILFGKVNPSARLPLTFPRRLEDNPSYLNFGGENGKVYYAEGVFVGYRHFEKAKKAPLFPFGWGKSYSTFKHSASLSSATIKPNEAVQVIVHVTNTGSRAGREVVQVYVHDVESSLLRPIKELKGFAKTSLLQPGATETVRIILDHISLGFFDDNVNVNKWVAEKGSFKVCVGSTSTDIHAELALELTESFSWI